MPPSGAVGSGRTRRSGSGLMASLIMRIAHMGTVALGSSHVHRLAPGRCTMLRRWGIMLLESMGGWSMTRMELHTPRMPPGLRSITCWPATAARNAPSACPSTRGAGSPGRPWILVSKSVMRTRMRQHAPRGKADDPDSGGGTGPFFLIIENIRPWYASVCVRYASPDAYLRPLGNPWNTRDYKKDNGRYALYASVFRVTPFYGVFPYRARIPRIPAQAAPRNRRNQAEERGRKGMHHLMHTPRIPDPADAYPPASARDA